MTAAVAGPRLFDHLVASRPERDRGSVGATAASIAFHGALIAGVLILGARVVAPASEVDRPIVVDHWPELPPEPGPVEAAVGGGSQGVAIPKPPDVVFPEFPINIPDHIPLQGDKIVVPLPDHFRSGGPVVKQDAPESNQGGGSGRPGDFVVVTQMPRLLNRPEVQRTMQRLYPTRLMEAGIGGTAVVWLRLDEDGRVIQTEIKASSGHTSLDETAREVGRRARFSPAYNGDTRVKVWVELPIVFTTR